jgi:hypothetical protein
MTVAEENPPASPWGCEKIRSWFDKLTTNGMAQTEI